MFKNETKCVAIAGLFMIGILNLFQMPTHAAGFSSSNGFAGTVQAKALAKNYTVLHSRSGRIHKQSQAQVKNKTIEGQIFKGFADASNKVEIRIDNKRSLVVVDQTGEAKTKIYLKNKNILAKSRARNTLKVKVEGEFEFESEDYAVAMGRFTPLGTQTQAVAVNRNRLEAKGLVRLETGNVAVSSAQVGN